MTTSNLPWFMDLTFQVPMQYCYWQHQTLLLLPFTSTTGCCFCFGSIPSFFLELFLHWSPVAYWAPMDLGSSSFSVLSLPFHTVHGVLKARILKWFASPFSSGPHSVRRLHHDRLSWVAPHAEARRLRRNAQKHRLEELPLAQSQGQRPGAPGCDGSGAAEWSYSMRATPRLRSGAAAERSYPTSMVRSRGCALLEQP